LSRPTWSLKRGQHFKYLPLAFTLLVSTRWAGLEGTDDGRRIERIGPGGDTTKRLRKLLGKEVRRFPFGCNGLGMFLKCGITVKER
jgi:hypothetical protein